MDTEQASYLGLIGSGLAIAAFFGLTLIGILFVRMLDSIERHCTLTAMRWNRDQKARDYGKAPKFPTTGTR
jgi:hypothetical protein